MRSTRSSTARTSQKMEDDRILKPTPRRTFVLDGMEDSNDNSPSTSTPASPVLSRDHVSSDHLFPPSRSIEATPDPFRRTMSVKNLTASALSAIYGSAYDNVPPTPGLLTRRSSGTNLSDLTGVSDQTTRRTRPLSTLSSLSNGAAQMKLRRRRRNTSQTVFALVTRSVLLFASGAAYGMVIARLHDDSRIATVNIDIDRSSPRYLIIWGLAGIAIGSLLPWIDFLWEEYVLEKTAVSEFSNGRESPENEETDGEQTWNSVIRSIGAFVGIAYAIRKLPWQSTLQASVSLSLVNPALWYLLDRSRTGFWLSTFVGILGTILLVGLNPDFVQTPVPTHPPRVSATANSATTSGSSSPAVELFGIDVVKSIFGPNGGEGMEDMIAVATWIASVLFCSSVCFGNIGRKLAVRRREQRDSWVPT